MKMGARFAPASRPGSYPKFCSLERIQSPNFPEDWQGSHDHVRFPRASHRALRPERSLESEPPTSGYITNELPDLVRTSDVSFRPIDVRLGPDGALYVADWSNPVINHGEVDFRDPRRDHHQGRIWRITRKGGPVVPWEKLTANRAAELAEVRRDAAGVEEQQAGVEAAYGPRRSNSPTSSEPARHRVEIGRSAALAEARAMRIRATRLKAMRALAQHGRPPRAPRSSWKPR